MASEAIGAGEPATQHERPTLRAWYILFIMVVATLFGFVDRQILIVLSEAIKRDLHLGDSELGIIQGLGPGLLAAMGVAFLGRLIDRYARQWILAGCVLCWSVATAACGLAGSFLDLVLASVAIGLGEAALGPILYSMIPDLFPGRSRIRANLIYFGAATVGGGFGMAFAGATVGLVEAHGAYLPFGLGDMPAWRVAFFLAAVPGLPLAIVIAAVGAIPRIAMSSGEPVHASLKSYLAGHWRTLAGIVGGMCFYGIALHAIFIWSPVYIIRILKASPSEVGFGFGASLTMGSVAGVFAAGFAMRRLGPALGALAPLRIFQAAMCLAAIPLLAQLFITRPVEAYVLTGLQVAASVAGTSLISTILQDISPAAVRGRVLTVTTFAFTAVTGLAPIVVGIVSDLVPPGSPGLLWAIVGIAAPGFLLAALLLRLSEPAFQRTLEQFGRRIKTETVI